MEPDHTAYLTFAFTIEGDHPRRSKVISINNSAKRRSIMSESQYLAYQEEFGTRVPMRPPRRDVKGIGVNFKVIGEATIQIPFTGLNILLDIDFSMLKTKTPPYYAVEI